jgi:cytochrome c-type biogenesis protein
MLLLSAYSLGLAVPFLLAALLLRHFIVFFTRVRGALVWVSRVSGALLVAIGLLMLTNYFSVLASYLQSLTPAFLLNRL